MATNLSEIADLCERAKGPSRELDYEIYDAIGKPVVTVPSGTTFTNGAITWAPFYTASLDAAMTLTPDNCLAGVKQLWDGVGRGGYAILHAYDIGHPGDGRTHAGDYAGVAATPALALTAAALRARQEKP